LSDLHDFSPYLYTWQLQQRHGFLNKRRLLTKYEIFFRNLLTIIFAGNMMMETFFNTLLSNIILARELKG